MKAATPGSFRYALDPLFLGALAVYLVNRAR